MLRPHLSVMILALSCVLKHWIVRCDMKVVFDSLVSKPIVDYNTRVGAHHICNCYLLTLIVKTSGVNCSDDLLLFFALFVFLPLSLTHSHSLNCPPSLALSASIPLSLLLSLSLHRFSGLTSQKTWLVLTLVWNRSNSSCSI